MLIGAQPRQGQDVRRPPAGPVRRARPVRQHHAHRREASQDWLPLKYVAHRFIQGTHPTKDGDPVEQALDALREIDRHIVHVNEELEQAARVRVPRGETHREAVPAP